MPEICCYSIAGRRLLSGAVPFCAFFDFALQNDGHCATLKRQKEGGMQMRCSCQNCGIYMVQDERGLESRCICPNCFSTCNACMGTEQSPVEGDRLEWIAMLRERYDREHGEED